MKKMIIVCVVFLSSAANALMLNVRKVSLNAKMKHTDISSVRSSETASSGSYEITILKNKYDKGEYILFAMTRTLVSEANGNKTTREYVWIPDSFKQITLDDEVGKYTFIYTTPSMKYEKEKWAYIGDYSKGAKLNGVCVGICDVSSKNKKIVKFFRDCSCKTFKKSDEVEKLSCAMELQMKLDELDYFIMDTCKLVKKEE